MTQVVEQTVYTYDELGNTAREKVLDRWTVAAHDFLNDDFDYVKDYVWETFLDPFGVHPDFKLNYCVGDWSGLNGANFTGRVDLNDWMDAYLPGQWTEFREDFLADMSLSVDVYHDSYVRNPASTEQTIDFEDGPFEDAVDDWDNEIEAEAAHAIWLIIKEDFETWMQDVNDKIYNVYRMDYESLTSSERMEEEFIEVEALFFEDGTRYQ